MTHPQQPTREVLAKRDIGEFDPKKSGSTYFRGLGWNEAIDAMAGLAALAHPAPSTTVEPREFHEEAEAVAQYAAKHLVGSGAESAHLLTAIGEFDFEVVIKRIHPQATQPALSTFNSCDFEGTETVAAPSTAGEVVFCYTFRTDQAASAYQSACDIDEHVYDRASFDVGYAQGKYDEQMAQGPDYDGDTPRAALLQSIALPVDVQELDTKPVVSQIQPEVIDKAALPVGELTDGFPFHELKYIMRVLDHKSAAPQEDWDRAYRLTQQIFKHWHAESILAAARSQPVREPLTDAPRKLIGWRTSDYLMETSDVKTAKNWKFHYEILPIFEGDTNTKLNAPPVIRCPEKLKPGGCQLHNLHCGWPKCNEGGAA